MQAAGCVAASLLLGFFDFSLGVSVLLGGVVVLVPNAWFVRQIVRADGLGTESAAFVSEAGRIARVHMVQTVVRLLATLIFMGVVIAGYESLNPFGFFGCIAALALMYVLVPLGSK